MCGARTTLAGTDDSQLTTREDTQKTPSEPPAPTRLLLLLPRGRGSQRDAC